MAARVLTAAARAMTADLARRSILALIRAYQILLSPLFAGSCRYVPSCSNYAAEAVERFGAARGAWLALRRLMRCHPLGGHGFDPVPASAPSGLPPSRSALWWTSRRGKPQSALSELPEHAACCKTTNL